MAVRTAHAREALPEPMGLANIHFDGRLEVSPPLTDEQLAQVPAARGVAALLGDADQPIVLLPAADIRARLRTRLAEPAEPRRKSADLRQITRAVVWQLAEGWFEADLKYLELAGRYWPDRYASMLAWKPACWVHADLPAARPGFVVTRDRPAEGGGAGEFLGPFPSERAGRRFVEILQDVFSLCRNARCLAGRDTAACSYGQMGKCLAVCTGAVNDEQYRLAVAQAARCAAGARAEIRRELEARMQSAAGELKFEQAASVKASLERLAELNSPDFSQVRPAGEFRFIMFQSSGRRKRVRVFFIDRGWAKDAGDLKLPSPIDAVAGLLERMSKFCAEPRREWGELERWRMGLAASYLFSSPRRRGLMVHWQPGVPAAELAGRVERFFAKPAAS